MYASLPAMVNTLPAPESVCPAGSVLQAIGTFLLSREVERCVPHSLGPFDLQLVALFVEELWLC